MLLFLKTKHQTISFLIATFTFFLIADRLDGYVVDLKLVFDAFRLIASLFGVGTKNVRIGAKSDKSKYAASSCVQVSFARVKKYPAQRSIWCHLDMFSPWMCIFQIWIAANHQGSILQTCIKLWLALRFRRQYIFSINIKHHHR